MVHNLPEGWRLPSILTFITQIAQIGEHFVIKTRFKFLVIERFFEWVVIFLNI